MLTKNRTLKDVLILIFLSYIFFVMGNGILSLTNPDEVFYAQTAKEMIQHKSWMTPYLFGYPQFEKPILLYWLLRIGFVIFGVSSFGARFFPALFATIGVIAVYWLGSIGFKNRQKAFFSSIILLSSGLYIGLGRTVFTDMIFSVFILLSISGFYWAYSYPKRKTAGILLFFIFSSLAVLTKGPLGFLLPFLSIILFLLVKKDLKFLIFRGFLFGFLLFLLLCLPWYIFMVKQYGYSFTHEFFYNDHIRRLLEAEHTKNDTWYFYPLSMIGCMFPWSLFLISAFLSLPKNLKNKPKDFYLLLSCWIAIVVLIFEVAHSKLVSYIFPVFPGLALITSDFICESLAALSKKNSRLFLAISLATVTILLVMPIGLIICLVKYPAYIAYKAPLYWFITVFLLFMSFLVILLMRKKFTMTFYALTCTVILPLFMVPFIKVDLEPYISLNKATEYLLSNYNIGNTIICSAAVVRSVKYYTDKEVAVLNTYGTNFFSPHPLTFLDSEQQIKDLLLRQPVTYCVLKKSLAKRIAEIVANEFSCKTLAKIGDQYIVQISRPKG